MSSMTFCIQCFSKWSESEIWHVWVLLHLNGQHVRLKGGQETGERCNKGRRLETLFTISLLFVILQADVSNICWFQLPKCKNLLLFFVVHGSKWAVFRFWMISWTKEAIWRHHFGHFDTNCVFYRFLCMEKVSEGKRLKVHTNWSSSLPQKRLILECLASSPAFNSETSWHHYLSSCHTSA